MFYFAKFRWRNFAYGALWLVIWPVFTNIERSIDCVVHRRRRCWLSKDYFQCEKCSLSKEKFWNFSFEINFEINFQCERGLKRILVILEHYVFSDLGYLILAYLLPAWKMQFWNQSVAFLFFKGSNLCFNMFVNNKTLHGAHASMVTLSPDFHVESC